MCFDDSGESEKGQEAKRKIHPQISQISQIEENKTAKRKWKLGREFRLEALFSLFHFRFSICEICGLGFVVQVDGVDDADDGGVDGGAGPADRSHRAPTFRGEEHAVAHAGLHGVEGEDSVAAVGAVKIERLHDEDFLPLVGGRFLGGDNVADDASD
jgi:hypothetical protein